MPKKITLSSDEKTLKEFEELSVDLRKSKSQLFREMVRFFHANRERLENGFRMVGDDIEK